MIATSRAPVRLFWNDHNRWEWLGRVALVGLAAGAVLAIAGLPPVDVHGPLHYVGIMDPLCGGTRGLRLMMRGHLASAWRDNPLAVFLPPAAVAALAREATGRITGRWADIAVGRRLAWAVTAVALTILEINQQAHAALLTAH